MANQLSQLKTFNNYPYYDDFDPNNNFYRVLFRPGYSVQTREVNQLQTILQQQISYMADYALSDKTAAFGGNINFNKNVNFIKLTTGTSLSRNINEYNTNVKFEAEDGITGDILFVIPEDATGPTTLYVKYLSSGITTGKHTPRKNSQLTLLLPDGNRETVQIENTDTYSGMGTIVSLDDSIFYVKKTFVRVSKQLVVLEKYNQGDIANYKIGILINDEVITAGDDYTLYDNAYGTPNEAAQGADRYKISGILVDKNSLKPGDEENFIELIRLDKGEVAVKPKEENPVIPLLQQIMARRTYDESGDYIVDTFDLDIREHLFKNNNNGVNLPPIGKEHLLVAQLDPGVAYIRGYEVRINESTKLDIPKAREVATVKNNISQLNYTNHIIIQPTAGDITLGSKLNFHKANNNIIGYGYVAGVEVISTTQLRVSLINIINTESPTLITKVNAAGGVSSMVAFASTLVAYNATTSYSPLVYSLPYGFSKNTEQVSLQFNKTFTTISTNGKVSIANEDNTEVFSMSANDYYIYIEGVGFCKPGAVTGSNTAVQLDVSSVSSSGQQNVKVIAKLFSTAPRTKSKTLTGSDGLHKDVLSVNSMSNNRLVLSKADGYKLIKVLDSSGNNITNKFTFDSGARDSHYQKAALVLKSGIKLEAGSSVIAHYSYFSHSAVGDFFTVDSYLGMEYNTIPVYIDSASKEIFLGSAYDFRKIVTGDYIDPSSRGHVSIEDRVLSNITYYLPRKDRIMVTSAGNIVAIQGTPDFEPKFPDELNDAITIYNLTLSPYTFSINDVKSEKLNHKRYTMRDIGKLDNRLTNVEEVALLNKLEGDTASVNFSDRFKSGYIVDNFMTSNTGDIDSKHFGVAYDLIDPLIRPKIVSEFLDMETINSSNIKIHKNTGIATLNYTVEPFISQTLASDIVKLQPYMIYGWGTGTLQLTPSVDIWKEELRTSENVYTSSTNRLDDIIIKTSQTNTTTTSTGGTTLTPVPTPPKPNPGNQWVTPIFAVE